MFLCSVYYQGYHSLTFDLRSVRPSLKVSTRMIFQSLCWVALCLAVFRVFRFRETRKPKNQSKFWPNPENMFKFRQKLYQHCCTRDYEYCARVGRGLRGVRSIVFVVIDTTSRVCA